MSYPIPTILLETLQSAFQHEAKKICAEVAETLGIPKQQVIKKVLNHTSFINLIECETPHVCMFLQKEKYIYTRCRKHALLGTGRCVNHQNIEQVQEEAKQVLRKLINGDAIFWLEEETGKVFDSTGSCVGTYAERVLRIYDE
jgi:hypothetical protein